MGAEEQGDLYAYNITRDFENLVAMDTMRTATWARNLLNNLASIRTVAQQMTVNCHSYVVAQ